MSSRAAFDKPSLRADRLAWRDGLGSALLEARAEGAARLFRDWATGSDAFAEAACVSGFWAVNGELDPRPALAWAGREGRLTCLPVVAKRGERLVFRRWQAGDAMDRGVLDIPVPREAAPVVEPDILLVPLLAFDRRGGRLGYGGGYYDRTLAALRPAKPVVALGWAHSEQEVDEVPMTERDMPLDGVITERAYIDCR